VLEGWIQIALIFSGVMGVLGLLSEKVPGRTGEPELLSETLPEKAKEMV
jgi:hypothetical protein